MTNNLFRSDSEMRQKSICPKCECTEILEIAEVPDKGEFEQEVRKLNVATISKGRSLFGSDRKRAVGDLRAVVCRRCGYTEFYTRNPQSIPVDGKYVKLRKEISSDDSENQNDGNTFPPIIT